MATKTQSELVFDALRADILACRQRPGAKLRINEIAESQRVSLGAAREALSRLGAEGLVVAESQKGYRVTPLSVAELLDLTDARLEIESLTLRRSVARGDLDWETALVGAWHRLKRLPEYQTPGGEMSEAWAVAHADFHQALASACGSTTLLRIRRRLYEQSERYRRYAAPIAKINRDVTGEHLALYEAAMARDAALVSQLIAEHLQRTASLIVSSPRLAGEPMFADEEAPIIEGDAA